MINSEKINEIREFLNKSQNPLFFFDNDLDGLASFMLLRRYCNKGKGISIKTFPDLNSTYSRKLSEFSPDCVFIIDKPLVSKQFIQDCNEKNIPIVWIDHHPKPFKKEDEDFNKIFYFNPLEGEKPTNEPTSYWCYKISGKQEDEWISMLGCISDWFLPEFANTFAENYPDLFIKLKSTEQAKALYETELGKLAKIINFGLKDRTSNVVKMIKYLLNLKSPREILEKNIRNATIYHRFSQVERKYAKLLQKAKEIGKINKNLLFFQYGGELSLSGELANELFYNFPDLTIVVCYIKGAKVNVSIRSKDNARAMTIKSLEGIESTAGGHENACGATLSVEDLPKFRDNMIKLAKNLKG